MKKVILLSFAFLFLAPYVLAAVGDFVPLAPIPGLTDIQYAPNGLAAFFNNLYKFAIGLAAALAVIMIIWGGLEISTQDSVSKKSDGKARIYNAIFGLVLVLSPVLVFSVINPSILNLSLNLPPLDTKSTMPPSTPNLQQAQQTLQNARQQGTLDLTPAQQQELQQAIPVVQQTATSQKQACISNGGKVESGTFVQNGCTTIVYEFARRDGYATCTVLADNSVCFSK